ncbi:pyrroline-5-carboxylate reductase [Sphingomonas piscis]|uniref:Pyrroline-5-carboxylate reductase n=1 Tax=Sphingomonas piscis TaxID=2714943 RepID=A0A6G7YMC8_9SPHN|nr:pyrroline-5-carboxylate reductase [Sphingomonas piscis]QIK77899.1 pyrroline-5-carboxylate reductase [Sphingomonas piscis]
MNIFPSPTWLIGCGNMTGALVDGWRSATADFAPVTVVRPSGTPVEGVRTVTSAGQAGPPPRLVVLGFKPQQLGEVAPQLAPYLSAKTIVLSLLAGANAATLRRHFPGAATIVRAMPNLAVAVRRGVTALYSEDAGDTAKAEVSRLFEHLGFGLWTLDEARFGAVGAVAGSGPAYVARFIDALAKGGVARGLSPDTAQAIAVETVYGTGWLAASTRESMDDLARRVASPKGTTEAGLAVLDQDGRLDSLVMEVIDAAAARGTQLGSEVAGSDGLLH